MIRVEYVYRPDYIIIQVFDDNETRGSLTVPISQEHFWKEVGEFIRVNQRPTDPPVTRIN